MRYLQIIFTITILIQFTNCSDTIKSNSVDLCFDIDGNEYRTVTIGTQIWMAENLRVTHYQNGDSILHSYHLENIDKYGILYGWRSVNDDRKIAPEGWHIPTDDEWNILLSYIGDSSAIKIKSKTDWYENRNGTDIFGFTALPTGTKFSDRDVKMKTSTTVFWTSTEDDDADTDVWIRSINASDYEVKRSSYNKVVSLPVRCIKD